MPVADRVEPGAATARAVGGASRARLACWCETGLGLSLLLLPSQLALLPRGVAPLTAFAGLCAAGLVGMRPPATLTVLRRPAAIFAALILWGALSATWSIDPARSVLLDLRLLGLSLAAIALAAAADRIAEPRRVALFLLAGIALGIALAGGDLLSAGGLSHIVSVRPFFGSRFNQIAAGLTLLVLPATAVLLRRGRVGLAWIAAVGMTAVVYVLDDTTAKIALAVSLPAAALLYWRRRVLARVAAGLTALAILCAPLTLPRLAGLPAIFATVDAVKASAGHRLAIWSFVGDRIAERPWAGWGLDAARAIPGGTADFRVGQVWLPLHPHDAALQVWLELGAPGAVLLALLVGLLWLYLAEVRWPRIYAAAAGGSLAAATAVGLSGWGIWQEWWIGTQSLALFAILVMARAAIPRGSFEASLNEAPQDDVVL